jgi:Fe-S-cluster containining protein
METQNGNATSASHTWASAVDLAELDRQVERGSLFTQATLQKGFERINGMEALLAELIRALTARGLVTEEDIGVTLEKDAAEVAADEADLGEGTTHGPVDVGEVDPGDRTDAPSGISWPTIAIRVDDHDVDDQPDIVVDCDARMHVCQAVCCKLKFPLSVTEVDEGHVKWDIGHPYIIRHESSGLCTHNDAKSGHCGIYADRPGICRRYSCANDVRIWKDFDNMVLNEEWMEANLVERDIHIHAIFPSMEEPEVWDPASGEPSS